VKKINIVFASFVFFVISGTVSADPVVFESGTEQTILIELYTSEGCSSCPPAETYLNSFKKHPRLWKRYIPVAFHVDYWDYLGWKDPYARAENDDRQREYARALSQRTIYTPAFFVNGHSWRQSRGPSLDSVKTKKVGDLRVIVEEKRLRASFNAGVDSDMTLHVAWLAMDQATDIRAGENEGRYAEHEFVLVGHTMENSENNRWSLDLPELDRKHGVRYALVVWVSQKGDPRPLQATGGYMF
jgi:hypothetical protein